MAKINTVTKHENVFSRFVTNTDELNMKLSDVMFLNYVTMLLNLSMHILWCFFKEAVLGIV